MLSDGGYGSRLRYGRMPFDLAQNHTGGGSANLCFRHLQCVFLLFAAGIAAVEANRRFARSLQIETQILGGKYRQDCRGNRAKLSSDTNFRAALTRRFPAAAAWQKFHRRHRPLGSRPSGHCCRRPQPQTGHAVTSALRFLDSSNGTAPSAAASDAGNQHFAVASADGYLNGSTFNRRIPEPAAYLSTWPRALAPGRRIGPVQAQK